MNTKRIYLFHEGNASMRDLLGGKGANLAEMSNIGLPVPPGFTITTDVCREYYQSNSRLPDGLMTEVFSAIKSIEQNLDKKFGDIENPLLVSVRSGSKFSMPGMMDTILNLGLNDQVVKGLADKFGCERFAYDSYRRFIMMFSDVVLDISKEKFEKILEDRKASEKAKCDSELSVAALKDLCQKFQCLVKNETGLMFPQDPHEQLEQAIEAVFRSWDNPRAIIYRQTEKIPDDIGTAVNVQSMVFGNLGDDCGTGVAFTRDPISGENELFGEYLMNAQGEDVVAGIRTPLNLQQLKLENASIYNEFLQVAQRLENHYKDMMDIEFTVEKGRLFILQCRVGKRTGFAAVKIAHDLHKQGSLTLPETLLRISANHLDQLLHPRLDETYISDRNIGPIASGLAASPGAATGVAVFHSEDAIKYKQINQKVILVRSETNPDDVGGMLASEGILTARGGKTSHAAVVARGFGIPCVSGCEKIVVNEKDNTFTVGHITVTEGSWITIDGTTGRVFAHKVPLIDPEMANEFKHLMDWCDQFRQLEVRTNADNPRDAQVAVDFGCEGIGLCRTEHMFFEANRLPIVQEMILTKNEVLRESALAKLLPIQQSDFEGIFEVMDGKPVTIRLIDPPLHEFLPNYEDLLKSVTEMQLAVNMLGGTTLQEELKNKQMMLGQVEQMKEANPMLGLRGVRLSIVFPGIIEMQVRAILQAAAKLIKKGVSVSPEIMIPLVGHVNEFNHVRKLIDSIAAQVIKDQQVDIRYTVGTMIEIPRAALTADEIAREAEFFSFGTNDLTQTTFGFSRDDAEGKFLQQYIAEKILKDNPFETIDQEGVGSLMRLATENGRKANPSLKIGICGEHAGDPRSIDFCHRLGLEYVSCSPYRIPIAKLSAAQAAIRACEQITVE
jgi:pyruvate,orthophosphate dikinase